MATHDYSLANQSGASFRSDLNNCLSAILSNNSNSSAPSTTVAYMLWADTSNAVLKIRNSANNAWVELFQLDGTLTMEDGAEATPGLAFRDDLNTGIWSSAADTFNISTAGTERLELGAATVFNESGANVDFRIEGDSDANLFYVDAGNDRIGIGTASPGELLEVSSDSSPTIRINNSDGSISADQVIGSLEFKANDGSGDGSQVTGSIKSISQAAFSGQGSPSHLIFSTNGVSGGGALAERLRITHDGNVGIGTDSPSTPLHVKNAGSTACKIILENTGSGSDDSTQIWSQNNDLAFNTNDAEELRILSGGGITFNGDTAQANALDDYEEGTFTPTWAAQYGSVDGYTHQYGFYTKIGRIVIATFDIKLSDKGDISGSYNYLTGLPVNHAGSRAGSAIVHYFQNLNTAVSSLSYEAGGASPTVLWLTGVAGTSATGTSYIPVSYITDTTNIYGTVIYRV